MGRPYPAIGGSYTLEELEDLARKSNGEAAPAPSTGTPPPQETPPTDDNNQEGT